MTTNPHVVARLRSGDLSFGHQGLHCGNGTENCPRQLHHHHDVFCDEPSIEELIEAGISPREFRSTTRR